MSLIGSIKGKDQLLLNGFRYRRDRWVWRCVKDECTGRAHYHGMIYKMSQDDTCQAPDTNEIEKALFNYEIGKKAEQCHDPPRLLIQDAELKLFLDAAITIPQYTASQRAFGCIQKDKDIPTEPQTYADIIIPPNSQITVVNQQFLLHDNNIIIEDY